MSVRLSSNVSAQELSASIDPINVSFRDPAGSVVISNGRAFRVVNEHYKEEVLDILHGEPVPALIASGALVNTIAVDDVDLAAALRRISAVTDAAPLILEHEHIDFSTYPYEWPAEMLYAAAELTLDLMEQLLPHGLGLKDASPYNILFKHSRPILVDLLSLERRNPLDPTWLAYAQFVRTFIRPLLANKHFNLGLDQVFRVYRDGLQPEHVFHMCGWWRRLSFPFRTVVTVPTLLARMNPNRYQGIYNARQSRSSEQAAFILDRQLKGLRRKLRSAKPNPDRPSIWANYPGQDHQERNKQTKEHFLKAALERQRPRRVLDVGCNVGDYSEIAARSGASVVAIDQDAVVVGRLWRRSFERNLKILPLVVDIARPTAGLGWRNQECRPFLDRATNVFDCVLLLAVMHHLLVTERVPLGEILKLVYDLTTHTAIIEFVAPDDPMFRLLTRGNERLYEHVSREHFESESSKFFVTERSERIGDTHRWLYWMRRVAVV
ncbi:MAG: SAM-dependent methyltransferase [Blastocatellia bacterium]|nr:MAG: SAM-dependent methyltransferase [Blastocatellia bacterium]